MPLDLPVLGSAPDGIGHPRLTLDAWTARHGIVDDRAVHCPVLARLRKTHKALWYRKTNGHMARFAIGHTVDVAARHYADLPSLRPLHEDTVADAFTGVLAVAGPLALEPARRRLGAQGGRMSTEFRQRKLARCSRVSRMSGWRHAPAFIKALMAKSENHAHSRFGGASSAATP